MSDRNIGIKLANGQFYTILEDGKPARKRLVVTTVKDDQPSVQIDMYRGSGETAASASYIGSLVIENIPPRPKGEPDIRLELSLDDQGELLASAREEASGESQSLRVSLKALSEEETYEIPDFEFEEETREAAATDELPDLESAEFEVPEMTESGASGSEPATSGPEDSGFGEDLLMEEGPESEPENGESYIGQSTESRSMGEDVLEEASFGEPFPEDSSFEEPGSGTEATPFEEKEEAPKPELKPERERKPGRVLWILLIILIGLALALGLGLLIYRCTAAPKPPAASMPAAAAPAAQPEPAPQPAPAPPAPQPAPAAQPAPQPQPDPAPAEPPKALPAGMAAYVR
ncbi:MAG: Hsp70 family protein, partial [Treponema sp.]|nr:Hsp70 family protein [Treponema sp.]